MVYQRGEHQLGQMVDRDHGFIRAVTSKRVLRCHVISAASHSCTEDASTSVISDHLTSKSWGGPHWPERGSSGPRARAPRFQTEERATDRQATDTSYLPPSLLKDLPLSCYCHLSVVMWSVANGVGCPVVRTEKCSEAFTSTHCCHSDSVSTRHRT